MSGAPQPVSWQSSEGQSYSIQYTHTSVPRCSPPRTHPLVPTLDLRPVTGRTRNLRGSISEPRMEVKWKKMFTSWFHFRYGLELKTNPREVWIFTLTLCLCVWWPNFMSTYHGLMPILHSVLIDSNMIVKLKISRRFVSSSDTNTNIMTGTADTSLRGLKVVSDQLCQDQQLHFIVLQ